MALRHLLSHHVLHIKERWGVAYQRSDWRHLVMWRAKRIPNPRGHFLADPFVVEHQGQHYCFVEDYDDQKAKGAIAVYRLDDQGAQRLGIALENPFHLSFPYLFQYESQWYMCPESCEQKHIQLYRCEEFPLRWKPAVTPMKNVAAADTLLIEKNGRWWMLTTMDPANTQDYCTQLSIFYADHPLSENWIPHARNPIYVDALHGRNGGIVSDGDRLYRIAQRQGFTGYGQAFSIREIVTLTPELFVEKEVTTIQPRFFSSLYGTHHLHSNGTYCVFDFLERKRG